MWDSKSVREGVYIVLAVFATLLALMTAGAMFVPFWPAVFSFYAFATSCRLLAGGVMNRMGDAEVVNAWNNNHHRFVVIALNAGVGVVLLGELWWMRWSMGERYDYMRARWFLTIAVALYLVAACFTRPNTFVARVRSATLTVVLLMTMAYLAFGMQYYDVYLIGGGLAVVIVFFRLIHLADRFDWADR